MKQHIFLCESKFALFSMLIVKTTMFKDEKFDVLFTDTNDYGDIIDKLRTIGIFQTVCQMSSKDIVTSINQSQNRTEKAFSPEKYLPIPDLILNQQYTDLWINLDTMCPKLFYYALVNIGNTLNVHFIDEGNSSYFVDLLRCNTDYIKHDFWKEKKFSKNCIDTYLFMPELYHGGNSGIIAKKIAYSSLSGVTTLLDLFGYDKPPSEKYIFFEQCFAEDGYYLDDLTLVDEIANVVGKENLLIRLHPRSANDRFSPFGFHTLASNSALWETSLIYGGYKNKIFISVDSSAIYSRKKIINEDGYIIILNKIAWGNYRNKKDKKSDEYISEMLERCNADKIYAFQPYEKKELKLILNYMEKDNAL